jgi:hypothetical protein
MPSRSWVSTTVHFVPQMYDSRSPEGDGVLCYRAQDAARPCNKVILMLSLNEAAA